MKSPSESVYAIGARGGLVLGPVMALCVVMLGASVYSAVWSLPALVCCLAVPVIAYILLGRAFRQDNTMTFSALWLTGICAFFFGGLIMGAVIVVSLRWWQPGFIDFMVNQVIDIYSSLPDENAKLMADTLDKMRDSGSLPGPIDCALQSIYGAVFSGSILSMIYAAVIRRTSRR